MVAKKNIRLYVMSNCKRSDNENTQGIPEHERSQGQFRATTHRRRDRFHPFEGARDLGGDFLLWGFEICVLCVAGPLAFQVIYGSPSLTTLAGARGTSG